MTAINAFKIFLPLIFSLLILAGCQKSTAQPPSPHLPLERAVSSIRDEIAGVLENRNSDNSEFRFYAALSTMNYIQTNLSSARHSLLLRLKKLPETLDTDACLENRIGICGNHIQAFLDIMKALDIPSRSVQVYYEDKNGIRASHIVAEVEWEGHWHMFDITWGFIAIGKESEILSFEQLRRGEPYRASINQNNFWFFFNQERKVDVFDYIHAKKSDVIVDERGIIHPYITKSTNYFTEYGLAHIPNYVGNIGQKKEIEYEFLLPEGFNELRVNIEDFTCKGEQQLLANEQSVFLTEGDIVFPGLTNKVRLSIKEKSKVCLAHISKIIALRNPEEAP